jgi:hypothetical protein
VVRMTAAKQWMKIRTTGSDAPIHSRDLTCEDNGCRPVVVIDPEDRKQVERLVENYRTHWGKAEKVADALQAALREFADPKPPKPKEPTGLGAVVEDEEGTFWVRDASVGAVVQDRYWSPSNDDGRLAYADINAVRVLSEGVQA